MVRIGIDIGGTKVNMGLLTEEGKVLARKKLPTGKPDDIRVLVDVIADGIRAMLDENSLSIDDVTFIGAGVPGTVDYRTGFVSYCPNLKWYDIPIGDYFREALGREVLVFQDSRNGALAEKLFGAGKDFNDFICITIGTGIGCGIIINGKVFHGAMNAAGEIGHTPIVMDGDPCPCGNSGCLESYVCGPAIARRAVKAFPEKFDGRDKSCEEVFRMACTGDRDMISVIDSAMDALACGIANAVNLLSPEAILISGGLSEYEELVIKPLRKKITARGYYSWASLNRLKVMTASLGSDAPMIGAAFIDKGI